MERLSTKPILLTRHPHGMAVLLGAEYYNWLLPDPGGPG